MQGLIIENISNLYKIKTEKGIYNANARGKFKKQEITPVVGDKVEIEILDENSKTAIIEEIKERQNYIKRPKMSNITQIILVVSSKNPKPDLLLLDKQLAFAEFLEITPIIVLNKTDLDKNKEFEKIKEVYEKIGYKVINTVAKENKGIEELKKALKGNVNAFSGNSGVGKSTLINAIFKTNITQEGEISQRNRRGKNTTTSTKLYEIDKDTYIADTPGFSTFDISEIKNTELDKYFKEFRQYIGDCEFVGCTHIKEENCGIKQAVQEGKIDKGRYERFCKMSQGGRFLMGHFDPKRTVPNGTKKGGNTKIMIEVSTSILSVKKGKEAETFFALEKAKTDYFHIDVMDGKFVEKDTNKKMLEYASYIKRISNLPLDIHLMVENIDDGIEEFLAVEPNIITFHYEACKNKEEVMKHINKIKENHCKVGLSVKPETNIEEIYQFLPYIHMCLVMTVEPGKGGQTLLTDMVEKISKLKKYIDENNIDIDIEADGGINLKTADAVKTAGANILVAGTAILMAKDYKVIIDELKK